MRKSLIFSLVLISCRVENGGGYVSAPPTGTYGNRGQLAASGEVVFFKGDVIGSDGNYDNIVIYFLSNPNDNTFDTLTCAVRGQDSAKIYYDIG